MSQPVIVVSGLPRSGTSLAMQAIHAGGIEPVTDGERVADPDNPRGYYEFERVKALRTDKAWLDGAAGKVVKVIHMLLPELPDDRLYRVVFMERELSEVLASQSAMLARSGRSGAALPPERLKAIYAQQLRQVHEWLSVRPNFAVLRVPYRSFVGEPAVQAARMAAFIGVPMDQHAMASAVDPSLYRNKA
ncbi:MAG: sulfotransferase [Planctomycetes bacterium]|nr:sulfotransferase [Planctomycetota bacterium]